MKKANDKYVKVFRRLLDGEPMGVYTARVRVKLGDAVKVKKFSTNTGNEQDALAIARGEADRMHRELVDVSMGYTPEKKALISATMQDLITEFIGGKNANNGKYIQNLKMHLEEMAESVPLNKITDMQNADGIRAAMTKLDMERKWSARSWNAWRNSGYHFAKWLRKFKGLQSNPFELIDRRNVKGDPKRLRRPWTLEEFKLTLAAAKADKNLHDQCLFVLAIFTGWRSGTVRKLVTADITLKDDGITLSAPRTKVKDKEARVAIITDTDAAQVVRDYLATRPIGGKLFVIGDYYTAGMTQHYMETARAKWVTEAKTTKERAERETSDFLTYKNSRDEYADFAALRMTWNHLMRLGGVDLKVRQSMLGHSDPKLTSITYDRAETEEVKTSAAVSANWLTPKPAGKSRTKA